MRSLAQRVNWPGGRVVGQDDDGTDQVFYPIESFALRAVLGVLDAAQERGKLPAEVWNHVQEALEDTIGLDPIKDIDA